MTVYLPIFMKMITSGQQSIPAPSIPTGLTATASVSNPNLITLGWTKHSTDADFFIFRSLTAVGGYVQIATSQVNDQSYLDNSVLGGITYYYKIQARNGAGTSSLTAEAHDTTITPSIPVPADPTVAISTAQSPTTIVTTWTDNSSGAGAETGFEVYKSTDGVTFALLATTGPNATSYNAIGLTALTPYWFKIRAKNLDGNGATQYSGYTNTSTATTLSNAGASSLRQIIPSTDIEPLANYLGAAKVPHQGVFSAGGAFVSTTIGSPRIALAYYANGNSGQGSLFICSRNVDYPTKICEMALPANLHQSATLASQISTCPALQDMMEPTEGAYTQVFTNANSTGTQIGIGNMAVVGSTLWFQYSIDYNGAQATTVLFNRPVDLSDRGHVNGPYQILSRDVVANYPVGGINSPSGELFATMLCPIPSDWQSRLGGNLLIGGVPGSNRERGSGGPCAFVLDTTQTPVTVNGKLTMYANTLFWYPRNHWLNGGTSYNVANNNLEWGVQSQSGINAGNGNFGTICFPKNSRSIMFIGTHGIAQAGYADPSGDYLIDYKDVNGFNWGDWGATTYGTADQPTNGHAGLYNPPWGTINNDNNPCHFDPFTQATGNHNAPYPSWIWLYDLNDVLAQYDYWKDGTNTDYITYKPWLTKPYYSKKFTPSALWRSKTVSITRYYGGVSGSGNQAGWTTKTSVQFYSDGYCGLATDDVNGRLFILRQAGSVAPDNAYPILEIRSMTNLG